MTRRLRSRLADNFRPVAHRLRRARADQAPFDWAVAGFAVAGGLVLILAVGYFLDEPLMDWAATLPDGVQGFFGTLTRFGRSDWLLIPTGIIAIAVTFGDWRRVSRRVTAAWWEIGTFAAVLFVVVAATGLTTDLLKLVVGRFRPGYVTDTVFAFAPFTFAYENFSFPSGHATTMGAVAVFAAFAPGILTIPIIAATALVAISRVIIGVHFASDIVGGALVGVGLGYMILRGMADAGIVFVVRADGRIGRRLGVVRRLNRRRAGPGAMAAGLWKAWTARLG